MRHKFIRPTKAEEARIAAGIAADADTYELSEPEFRQLRPVRGRPRSTSPKQRITIRLSADVLAKFKAVGNGWQTRIDRAPRLAKEPSPTVVSFRSFCAATPQSRPSVNSGATHREIGFGEPGFADLACRDGARGRSAGG